MLLQKLLFQLAELATLTLQCDTKPFTTASSRGRHSCDSHHRDPSTDCDAELHS